MHLPEEPDAASAGAVDWDYGLDADLKIAPDPDHAQVNRGDREIAIAEIVGDRRRELHFGNRDQVIDKVGKLKVFHLRFQVGHAVLQRRPVKERLRDVDALREGGGRNLITDLPGHCERPRKLELVVEPTESLAEIVARRDQTIRRPNSGIGHAGAAPIDDQVRAIHP